ncbi:MAG: peptidase S9 [Gemmatimonadota bacterium]
MLVVGGGYRTRLIVLFRSFLAGALVFWPVAAQSQYFGRNKVQYDRLDFRVLPTDHFRIHFYPAESLATADAARLAERWYHRHNALLNHEFTGNSLIFYADHADFQQSNVIEGEISQGTGGVTEGFRERVIMPFTGSYAETDHVLGHELVHVFQYRIAEASKGGLRALSGIPLWLIEGMAEYLSLGRVDPNTAMWLRDALHRDDLPTLNQLTRDPRYFPYRYGQALWAFIGGRYGDDAVDRVFRAALAGGWENGVRNALAISADSLGSLWHAAIRSSYGTLVRERTTPDRIGRAVAAADRRGDQNISPAISPDGRYVAYFSSRGLFGIDLYIAETATGRVIRQLTSVTSNPHFDALSFLNSAGAWSPDGRSLAYVVFAEGDNELNVVNVESGDTERRIRVSGVGAMSDPAWSPDGSRIAFIGSRGGISDIYIHEISSGQTRQVTNDREAQLQPSWSPDGSLLVYATDAGPETDFRTMVFGEMRLALLNVAGNRVQLLPRLGAGKHINPHFSPDGRAIYFVSDQDGVSDIYRMSPDGSDARRITTVVTGVSGISTLSPALTVAARTGTLLFSVFDQQGFSIRALEPSALEGVPVQVAAERLAGILPPIPATPTEVDQRLADALAGLPPMTPTATEAYRAGLKLDFIGGPQIGIAAGGGYGTGLTGGIAFSFSDELGNRMVQTVLQAQGEIRDFGGQVLYLNRERRWNWGVQAYHVPVSGGFATAQPTTLTVDGQRVPGVVYSREIQRIFFDNAQALTQYPLSSTRRLEFAAGGQRISFSRQIDSIFTVGQTVVGERRVNQSAGDALTFATASAAFVGDYSFFGFTSPVAGGRYRFEIAPNAGSLNYGSALLDYRRYFFAQPVTLAFRGMHFGRYGADAESDRLQRLFVGQPYLVRGYDPGGFDVTECVPAAGSDDECPQFNRLSGSRVAVFNAELRIPLFGTERFGLIPLSFLPTEISPFVDAGFAWSRNDQINIRFDRNTTDRVPVFSAGISARVNLLGFAVGEFYWARPFQRPSKSWVFGFQLQPGW